MTRIIRIITDTFDCLIQFYNTSRQFFTLLRMSIILIRVNPFHPSNPWLKMAHGYNGLTRILLIILFQFYNTLRQFFHITTDKHNFKSVLSVSSVANN
jgi:hypothetical protein